MNIKLENNSSMKGNFLKHSKWFLIIFFLSFFANIASAKTEITHVAINSDLSRYMLGLLKLALSYDSEEYEFKKVNDDRMSNGRKMEYIRRGKLSIMWTSTSNEKEKSMLPIRIPAYKGLPGYKVLIIRQGDQKRFDQVNVLDDLRATKIGLGRAWADIPILKSVGMEVVTTIKKTNLFSMLDGGRFYALPRGVGSAWREVKTKTDLDLTVEKNLLIIYRVPIYFFVGRENKALAEKITSGLEKAIADGSFNKYFYKSKPFKSALKNANLKARKAFYIDNSDLPKKTPLNRAELWFDVSELNEN